MSKRFFSKWRVLVLLLLILTGGYFSSKMVKAKGFSGLWDFVSTVSSNYWRGMDAAPEKIRIEIKENDMKRLEKKRKQALERGLIINDLDGDYVSGILHYQDRKISIRLRLKGHMTDHLQDEKWSFRIKVNEKDETFMGMKRFSIQHPGTRGYIYEWIYHELMKREGVIALRYKFIDVNVNGADWGIYAVEENFENELVENNGRVKGPVLRFDPDLYWVNRYNEYKRTASVDEFASYYSSVPVAYRQEKVLSDSLQKQYFLKAVSLMEGLREKKIRVSDAFDIPLLAKFHAIIDLVGGVHSIDWSDIKYYYNPVTGRLEPVAYESFTVLNSRALSSQYMFVEIDSTKNYTVWHEMIFSDRYFFEEYMRNLERVADPKYLDAFFSESNREMNANLAIIYKEFPYKKFEKQDYYKRQKQILQMIDPPQAVHAYINRTEHGKVILQIASIDALPVKLHSIELNGKKYPPLSDSVIASKPRGKIMDFREYSFDADSIAFANPRKLDSLKLNYSILGSSVMKQESVFPFPHADSEFIKEDLKNKVPTVGEFAWMKINESSRSITVPSGKHVVSKDLVIPAGYIVYMLSGSSIDLCNNARLISYSPFLAVGSEDEKIFLGSSDSTGQGIVLINAGSSKFKHVVFNRFGKVTDLQWKRTGAITFYESDATFSNCSFYDFRSEDALHFIRSEFSVRHCIFKGMDHDGLDADFSKGSIRNSVFEECRENSLDISMTQLTVGSVSLSGSRNAALNAKDGSVVKIEDLRIRDCRIALSAEDYALVNFKNISATDCEFGIVVYKNKPSAGRPKVEGNGLKLSGVKESYLQERKSLLKIDGVPVEKQIDNVKFIIEKGEKKK